MSAATDAIDTLDKARGLLALLDGMVARVPPGSDLTMGSAEVCGLGHLVAAVDGAIGEAQRHLEAGCAEGNGKAPRAVAEVRS